MLIGRRRSVRAATRLILPILASALLATSADGDVRCCRAVRTSFGYVSLPRGDVATAVELGNAVKSTAREVLGLANPRFAFVDRRYSRHHWGDVTRGGVSVYPWHFVHGTSYVATQPPTFVLRHELGHELFRRYVIPDTRPEQYGTDAPDWLDEAVAVAFEPPENQALRRCEAATLLRTNALLPLARFLHMDHPDLTERQARGVTMRVRTLTFGTTASKETPAFYAMSLAFPDFMVERTRSATALREVVRAIRGGATIKAWLDERLGSPGHKIDMDELNLSFLSWMGSDARYQCGR